MGPRVQPSTRHGRPERGVADVPGVAPRGVREHGGGGDMAASVGCALAGAGQSAGTHAPHTGPLAGAGARVTAAGAARCATRADLRAAALPRALAHAPRRRRPHAPAAHRRGDGAGARDVRAHERDGRDDRVRARGGRAVFLR